METLLATATDILKLETAVLVVVTAGFLVLAKIVSDLRAEVRALRGGKPAPAPAAAPAVSQPPAASHDDIPPGVFAAIAAAVYATLGEDQHIVTVSPAESLMWSREGRRSIFRSHSFR
jgi:hypothetical protein